MIKSILKLSKNIYVTSFIILIAVLNILVYLHQKTILCLGIFLLTICLVNSYTENITIGVVISLFVANIVFGGCQIKKELF